MKHLYLSPHLDDAILSCGGLIYQQRMAGESVAVINLCAGYPASERLSPLARQLHQAWGNLQDLITRRHAEDKAILDKWGVLAHYCDTPDSIYRSVNGQYLYTKLEALYNRPHPQEAEDLPQRWRQELSNLYNDPADVVVYAPLGVGNHVDHQLARLLARQLGQDGWTVWFYEDYPYVDTPQALPMAKAWFGPVTWYKKKISINVEAKILAAKGYKTQVPALFGDEQNMAWQIKRFTARTANEQSLIERIGQKWIKPGGRQERFWRAIWGFPAHAERIWRYAD